MRSHLGVLAIEQAPMNPKGAAANGQGCHEQNILKRGFQRDGGALRFRPRSPE
jgi:hypothetical protein